MVRAPSCSARKGGEVDADIRHMHQIRIRNISSGPVEWALLRKIEARITLHIQSRFSKGVTTQRSKPTFEAIDTVGLQLSYHYERAMEKYVDRYLLKKRNHQPTDATSSFIGKYLNRLRDEYCEELVLAVLSSQTDSQIKIKLEKVSVWMKTKAHNPNGVSFAECTRLESWLHSTLR